MAIPLDKARKLYPGAVAYRFGDNAALSRTLIALVRQGRKTATCGALRDYGEGGEPMPVVGRRDITLTWDGEAALITQTVSVEIMRFCEVFEAFALAEGENDDLEGWREDHMRYFRRNGGFAPDMELVCERFRLIEDFASGEDRDASPS